MKEKQAPLKIYSFSHPLMTTEWYSVFGNKFNHSLPFSWEMTDNYTASEVVIWDGVINSKNRSLAEKMIADFKSTKVLLLLGESMTLFKDHKTVELVNLTDLKYVEVSGWSILPEEILVAIETCFQKVRHV